MQVDSQLQPDPGDETAALLRVLIYKIDNTTFGDNIPTLPLWTGPPPTMVNVQVILFASLAVSLLSAFLAMLGKQWLNRYASTDMRGSAIERSQNRQRKLDGIVAWYFDHVMESLPLMLQAALLLLGCALSRYLWDISTIVALVVVGVTSFGLTFYLFVIVAGAISESCPYQTPGSRILRHLGPKAWGVLHVTGARHLGRAVIRVFSALVGAYPLVQRANSRLHGMYSATKQRFHRRTTPLGLRCISWTLQTSLDKAIHLSASKHLMTTTELIGLDPVLVVDCFNLFVGCINFSNYEVMTMRGLEQLATFSAGCLLRTLHHLSTTDPTSSILEDIRRRYNRAFPLEIDFSGLPFRYTMITIHILINQHWNPRRIVWNDNGPSTLEHTLLAQHIAEAARVGYQRTQCRKVPRWTLRFALYSLSLDPPPPVCVVANCLEIIATDLGCACDLLTITPVGERYLCLNLMCSPF